MKKLRKILCLLFVVGIVSSIPFGTTMAASRSEDSATQSVSEELSMKQLVSDMESGKIECVLWNEANHFGNEDGYREKNEYKIWINDTYSEEGYKVKEDVYQVIRVLAIKNDIALIEIPIDGDHIKESEFDIILKYEKTESIEAEQETLFHYSRSVKTNLGKITISGEKKLSEIQNFASKHGLSVNVTNLVRRTIISILMVISMSSMGLLLIWCIFSTLRLESKNINYKKYSLFNKCSDVIFLCLMITTPLSFLIWISMSIVDLIIS